MESQGFSGVDWVRQGDEDEIYSHLLELHSENGMFVVSERKVRSLIRQAINKEGGTMIGVIRGKIQIEASIGMVIDQWWYTEDWCLSERWNFVHPNYRKKNHARHLIDFAKWCDTQLRLPLAMGIISTSRTEAKERLYRRQLTHVGGIFMDYADHPIVSGNGEKIGSQYIHLNDLRAAVSGEVTGKSPKEQRELGKLLKKQAPENVPR
jgi:hypothetical protein